MPAFDTGRVAPELAGIYGETYEGDAGVILV